MREAIVLAGGLGTRLRSAVPGLPKPMAPVAGKPFLELLLRFLSRQGFGRVTLSVGYMADVIVGHFGKRFEGVDLQYEVEDEPLGTGGALRRALATCAAEQAFVFNGDTFLELEIPQLEACWKATLRPLIVARHVDNASRYDVLAVDQDGRIRAFLARGAAPSGLINAGCYVLPRDLFAGFEARAKFSFEQDYLPAAVRAREFGTFVTRARFIDIGVPEDYERAQSLLADLAR